MSEMIPTCMTAMRAISNLRLLQSYGGEGGYVMGDPDQVYDISVLLGGLEQPNYRVQQQLDPIEVGEHRPDHRRSANAAWPPSRSLSDECSNSEIGIGEEPNHFYIIGGGG